MNFIVSPPGRRLPSRRTAAGAVGQVIFSRCIFSVIVSLISSEQQPRARSPHSYNMVHMYFLLETIWISLLYICTRHRLCRSCCSCKMAFVVRCFAAGEPHRVINRHSLVINVLL